MKSFCIKTNNELILHYLLNEFRNIPLKHIYFSINEFCLYKNIIIHYKGEEINKFCSLLTSILSECILNFYEEQIITSLIRLNYFYFDSFEQKQIMQNTKDLLNSGEDEFLVRKEQLYVAVLSYIVNNKVAVLDGLIRFRLSNYITTIDDTVDIAVNKFLIEREYVEFINLLKVYINSQKSGIELIHLVYMNGETILLDQEKNILSFSNYQFNAKYLSDITFSANDYALNTLLSLIPEKIDIHLIDPEDEFINTLKLIFGERIKICTECNLCRTYRLIANKGVR